ncbi:MAG: class I SAM-dependent methyltransferase [Deltaproteobacteria bacterium]|nr:class I SAM-dependent methyltransferase [Deltaproteobacteria bacterium]
MQESPSFRKHDKYKANSYRSYNFRMPSRYDSCFWMKFCQTPLWDRTLIQELRPDIGSLRILDVGCATGRLLECLYKAGARELFGVDLAPRILEVAREKFLQTEACIELSTADAEDALPWDNGYFDAITLTGVLHHFFRPKDALSEIYRVLQSGGRLLVIDPCFFPLLRQVINAVIRVIPHDGDFHFYSHREAASLLADLGFEVRRTRRLGFWAFFAIAHKPNLLQNAPLTRS